MSRVPRVSGVAPPHVVPFPARHSEHLASARIPTDLSLSELAPGGQRVESKPQRLPPAAAAAAAAAAASFKPQSRSLGPREAQTSSAPSGRPSSVQMASIRSSSLVPGPFSVPSASSTTCTSWSSDSDAAHAMPGGESPQ